MNKVLIKQQSNILHYFGISKYYNGFNFVLINN